MYCVLTETIFKGIAIYAKCFCAQWDYIVKLIDVFICNPEITKPVCKLMWYKGKRWWEFTRLERTVILSID